MSDHPGKRPQSREIRTSLVDSGWSEVPPPVDEATAQLSQEDLRKIVQAHTPERAEPRELPRYESNSDDAPESEQVHSDDATKRIAYAALLGGSLAGRGGPRQVPDVFYEQPTLVGHQPLSEDAARKLAGVPSEPASVTPGGWTPPPLAEAERPLPSFDDEAEPSEEDFERAAERLQSSVPHAPEAAPPRARLGSDPLPQLGFDDSDLTVRAELKMPAEMFADAPSPGAVAAAPEPADPVLAAARAPAPAEVVDLSAELESAFAAAAAPVAAPSTAPALLAREPEAAAPRVIEQAVMPQATPLDFSPLGPAEREVPGVGQALAQRCRLFGMRVPLWLLWVVPLSVAGLAVLLALETDNDVPMDAEPNSAEQPARAVPSELAGTAKATLQERATRGDSAALRQLAERPEHERSVDDAVAIAKGRGFQAIQELQAFGKRLGSDASLLERTETKEQLLEYVHDPRTAPDALRLLSELPGPLGSDLLYEIWTGTKKSNDTTQLARELVYKPDVQARASEALKVALELRAEPACQSIPALLPRAEQFGDWRSLHLLGKLLLPRGCGDDQRADCYPCLRHQEIEAKINEAIKAVRSRPRPKP